MADLLERLKVALADRYRIEQELGSGGMATVYLAQDLKHERQVAVKVLRPELAAALGPERFHQEIKIAANLTHPHILPLHDSGDADGFLYYVMPHIEGQSLRDKLAHEGELPIGETVRILRDIVDALSEAHDHGVVHRDIKPDNVLLTKHHALVTDFGVAKAVSEATGAYTLTTEGVALGTPAYMSPEQAAADKHIDHRADIYAVGALAYELLTGRPPFTGTTPQEVLSAQVTQAPDPVTKYRATVPPPLAQVVMKCLEKKAADRWQSAEELLPQLEALATPSGGITPTDTRPIQVARLVGRQSSAIAVAAAAVVVLGGLGVLFLIDREPRTITLGRTTQLTHDPGLELDPAISPDGRMVAYAHGELSRMHIYLRQVTDGRALDLTEGLPGPHRWPQWSPDGTQIMFMADEGIFTIPALGGVARKVVDGHATSPAWSPDGRRIIYAVGSGIYVATLDGGEPEKIADDFEPHSFQWSLDGARIAYVSGNSDYVLSSTILANIAPTTLRNIARSGGGSVDLTEKENVYVSPAWLSGKNQLLYISNEGGTRDIYQLALNSSGSPAAEPIRLTTGLDALTMSLSADGGRIAYSVFRYEANVWSIRIPEQGTISVAQAEPVTVGNQVIEGITVSPDGGWLAFDSDRRGNQDIYRLALPDGEPEQLTTHAADDFLPSWSPDGQEIAFYSFRHGNRDIYLMAADGGSLQRLTDDPAQERYPDWSPDGNKLAFYSDKTGRPEIWLMSRESRSSRWSAPRQLTFDGGMQPRWSPDGRWIAYHFDGTLRVISTDRGEPRTLVRGGVQPGNPFPVFTEWSSDGSTVYYKARDSQGKASFWAVPVFGGSARQLVRFDDPSRPSYRPEFTTDGSRFYFTVGRQESDIWLMELVPD